jgi:hypothetical protein
MEDPKTLEVKRSKLYAIRSGKEIDDILRTQFQNLQISIKNFGEVDLTNERLALVDSSICQHLGDKEPKMFNMKIKGIKINILVTSTSSELKSLRKKLAELIEKEATSCFVDFLKQNDPRSLLQSGKHKLTESEPIKKAKLAFVENKTLPSIFPTQEKVAEKLFDMVKEKLQANSHLNIDSFQDFKFLIFLPNRVSLEEQTKD